VFEVDLKVRELINYSRDFSRKRKEKRRIIRIQKFYKREI